MKLFTIYKHLSHLAVLSVIVFTFSCKKLIEIPPNPSNQIATVQVFADSANATSAVTGIYYNFDLWDVSFSLTNGGITAYTAYSSDELTSPSETNAPFFNNVLLSDNSVVANFWKTGYAPDLYQMNACLEAIEASTGISASAKQQLIGETKVSRAFYYFNLVNLFGRVPIVTSTDYKKNSILPRASVDEVYSQIIADLTDARKLLKSGYPSAGRMRPNLHTASALLAKVYLYRERWAEAATLSTEIIGSGIYGMEADLTKVFLDGSKEAIWQLPAKGNLSQTTEGRNFVPSLTTAIPSYVVSDNLLNTYEALDKRRSSWFAQNTIASKVYVYPYKYKNRLLAATPTEDYMIFRLGEQYLIRSEARAHLSMPDSALADLNKVHVRAGLSKFTAMPANLLQTIMKERQVELCFEWGSRWFDLKRTNTADAVLGAIKSNWKPTAALYPIPFSEIQNNPFLIQNTGYN